MPKGQAALLVSKENAVILNGVNQESFLAKAWQELIKHFMSLDIRWILSRPNIWRADMPRTIR